MRSYTFEAPGRQCLDRRIACLKAAGKAALGDRFSYVVHPGVGHGLGPNVTVGPMLPALADQLADDLAAAAARCR